MAKRKVAKQIEDTVVDVQEVQASGQPFLEQYQNYIFYALAGLALMIGLWWGYKSLVVAPQQKEAAAAIWQAQYQFERDSFQSALDNPGGGYDGFLAIIDKYSGTPAGNSAKYYAGVCYLQLGDFDNAIKYMEDFDEEGTVLPTMKYGILGDCYSEKNDFAKAVSLYEKAAGASDNVLLGAHYLKKAGMLHEHQGNKEAALKVYQRLKKDFADQNSPEWRDIDKYIYRTGGGQ